MLARFNDWSGFPVFGSSRSFPVSTLRREMDRLFGDLEHTPASGSPAPSLTFEDTGEALRLRADLPGLTEKDVEISVTANVLSLKGARTTEVPDGYTAHRRERSNFSFARSYALPVRVDPEKVQASLKQGVLVVTLPKVTEAQPKRITVSPTA